MRALVMIVVVAAACGLGGCAATVDTPRTTPTTFGPQVVHFDGYQRIRFGDRKADLPLSTDAAACGPQLVGAPELSPVFDGDRLVLIWVNPPYRTPEGLTVGSTTADVIKTHPTAERLTPPTGSYVFPGLLVTRNDRAYLFLHDQATVQKTIVGFTEHARRLYTHGTGQC